jgi:hypothetical protein
LNGEVNRVTVSVEITTPEIDDLSDSQSMHQSET